MTKKTAKPCMHPPARLYCWMADNGYGKRNVPCVVCLDCRTPLTGAA